MTNFYREVQHRAQCGKHALNAVLHFVTRGEWSQLITDRDLCQMMARLPLDTYHRVLQDFFPEVECRYGEDVGAALKSAAAGTTSSASDNTNRSGGGGGRGGVELQNLDWVILLINGHYQQAGFALVTDVEADGPLFTVKGRNSESSKVTVKPAALAGPSLHPAVQRMATLNKSYGVGGSGGGFVSSSASTNVSASSPSTVSEKGGVYVFFDPTCSFPKNAASGLRTCLVHVDRNPYRKICDTAKRSVSPHHREGERKSCAGEAGGAVVPPGNTKTPAGAPEQTLAAAAAVAKTVRTPTGEPVGVEAVRGREVAARPKSGLLNGTVRTQAAYNQLMSKAPDKPRIPFRL
eukprot:g19465.t1